jgi:Periplasmic copper-binding protein (NosD)
MATSGFPCQAAHLQSGTDALAKIANAIKALPLTGGCVDARGLTGTQHGAATVVVDRPVTLLLGAVQLQVTANPAFLVQGNGNAPPNPNSALTVLGLDPTATVIVANQTNVTLFEFTGNIVALSDYFGGETLTIKRCGLYGGNIGGNGGSAGTVMVNTQCYPTTNFEQGLLLIEDNLIKNFGDTALKIGASVYFNRVHRNEFLCNHQAIYLDNNTEASIIENNFIQGPSAGPTVTSIGPMHRIVNNYFYRNSLGDPSNAPDILLQPEATWPSQSGGYVWIEDNRFGAELENLDPARRRIKLAAMDTTIVAGPAIVRGNQFLGPAAPCTISVPSGSTTATLTLTEGYLTNGLAPGVSVTIYNASNSPLNGTFSIATVVNPTPPNPPTQFTYTLPTSTSATNVGAGVRLADAPAIELDNPHLAWDVHGNLFVNYGVLIDDNQNPPGQTQNAAYGWGESLFVDNRVICPNGGYRVFSNEGNDFTWIRPPANSALKAVDPWPKEAETLSLRNRVPQSERLDLWSTNGLTVSPSNPGEPDPLGTNRAFLLTLKGATGSQNVASPAIDLSGLTSTSRLIIKFWAKQGTLNSLLVGLLANDVNWYGNLFTVSLGPDWKQYKFVTNQLYSLTDTLSLVFYPGDTSFTSGTAYLFAPQISDDDSDYYPTGTTSVLDTSAGSRFEKSIIVTSVKTTTHTGDVRSSPAVSTAAGLGAGTATAQAGSTDFSGVVVLSPGSSAGALGTLTLSYNVPFNGVHVPVVVATLQDGTSPWTTGTSQVRVTSSSSTSCGLAWVNGSPLIAGATYAIAYVVIGRA